MKRTDLLVEKRNTRFDTPCGRRLVGAQAIGEMQVLDPPHRLDVEGVLVGRRVEVQIPAKDLVTTFTAQDHLDAQGLDLAAEQKHRGRGPDRGDVVRLEVVDDVRQRVQAVLDREGEVVMLRPQELGHLERGLGVGRVGQPDREGVQLLQRLHRGQLVVVVDSHQRVLAGLVQGVHRVDRLDPVDAVRDAVDAVDAIGVLGSSVSDLLDLARRD